MAFVKKIMELTERSDTIDAKKQIIKLNKDIKNYKEKVRTLIESSYSEFIPEILSCEALIEEGNSLEGEVTNVKENVESEFKTMYSASDEISKIIEELEETHISLTVAMKLVKIDALIQKIKFYDASNNFNSINSVLNKIQLLISDPADNIFRRLDIYKSLKRRLSQERENMINNLETQFNSFIQLKEKSFPKTRCVTIIISKNAKDVTDCLNLLKECDYDFNTTVRFLMMNVFEAVVSRAVSLDVKEGEKAATMVLSYSTETITDELRPSYEVVFINLRTVLCFLLNINQQLSSGGYFLAEIFSEERNNFLDLICNECLIYSIPKTFEERSQSTMNSDIIKFNKLLLDLHFIEEKEGEKSLENYIEEVDGLFYEQFLKNVQSSANDILKRDLHDMILVSDESTLATTTPLSYPKSMISKSTHELIKLFEKLISQAKSCKENEGDKRKNLISSIKFVLENYSFNVQLHHAQLLSKIPQQSALFYNNCMYLSNWIMTCTDLEINVMDIAAHELKRQGEEFFECQKAKQKIQLLELLREFDPSQCLNAQVIQPEHFKPIRQCMRQMDLLKNVWQTILPTDLYNETMGSLLEVISGNIINNVTAMEDISTILANGLVDLIKTVDEKAQSLLDADCSVLVAAPNWQRLLHLQFILDASLVDISASWKNNEISQSFRADEVKRLIRALFQNTERRSKCLSSIV